MLDEQPSISTPAKVTSRCCTKMSSIVDITPVAVANQRIAVDNVNRMPIGALRGIGTSAAEIGHAFSILCDLYRHASHSPRFKSPEQREMISLTLNAVFEATDVLIVMKTGGGKTLAIAAACMEEKRKRTTRVTVVVSPLRALCVELQSRLQVMGLNAIFHDTQEDLHSDTEVIILTPEKCSSAVTFQMLEKLHRRRQLGCFFWDEAHVCLTWCGIRPVMLELVRKCAKFDYSSRFFLSASLPPALEKVLRVKGELPNMDVHRFDTNRGEIHYLTHTVEKGKLLESAVEIVTKVMEKLSGNARMIVYCGNYLDIRQIFESLSRLAIPTVQYFGSMEPFEKDKSFKLWTEYQRPMVMVATVALVWL